MIQARPRNKAASAAAILLAASVVVLFETAKPGGDPIGYSDNLAGGLPTAGYGHTGIDVKVGQFYDLATRQKWLEGDLAQAESTVSRCAPQSINVYQRAAFTSFAFNVGPGKKGVKDGFCILKSGRKPRHLLLAYSGDVIGSCNALLAWNHSGGVVVNGLTRRRTTERNLCVTPVPENDSLNDEGKSA